MHVRELVEVAGLLALNGPAMTAAAPSGATSFLEQYWASSKARFDNWSRVLKNAGAVADGNAAMDSTSLVDLRATLDEIFAGEMLTRVWTAVATARDRRWRSSGDEPVARSVLASHLEARHRAMELLLNGHAFSTQQAVTINRLRRRADRWTDVLIGGLWQLGAMDEFAVDAERAEDFAAELALRRHEPDGRNAWRLTLVSLRGAFHTGLSPIAANPDANARIVAGVLGCLQGELFDSTGLPRSLWLMRISATAGDAQGMINELLEPSPRVRATEPMKRLRRKG